MADSSMTVSVRVVGTQPFVAQLVTKEITRERADLTSPGGSCPMRRSYKYQPTPPRLWFGDERADAVHEENVMQRAASDALFVDAQENKSKYAAPRRDMARRARNKAAAGLARRVSDSKAARTERGAQPRSLSRAVCVPTVVGVESAPVLDVSSTEGV